MTVLQKPIKEFMTQKVVTVTKEDSIKKVFQLMEKHDIVGLPVVDDSQGVVGMVTESDLLKHFTTLNAPIGLNLLGSVVYLDNLEDWTKTLKQHTSDQVADMMNMEVVTITEDQTLTEAINLMSEEGVNRLPVVNVQGKLVGMITQRDILHQLAKTKTL